MDLERLIKYFALKFERILMLPHAHNYLGLITETLGETKGWAL